MKKAVQLVDAAFRFWSVKSNEYRSRHQLENAIPKGKKYKILKRMARLFDKYHRVENYKLTQCSNHKIRNFKGKLKTISKKEYGYKKTYYDQEIRNRFKILNRYWKFLGYKSHYRKKISFLSVHGKWEKQP